MSHKEFLVSLVELFEEHIEGDYPPDAVDFYEEFIELMQRHNIPISAEMMGITHLFDAALDIKKVSIEDEDDLHFDDE